MRYLLISVILVLLLTAGWLPAQGVDVGDKAPDFKLVGSDGIEYQLSQFIGQKPVVLAWFPKAFTGG